MTLVITAALMCSVETCHNLPVMDGNHEAQRGKEICSRSQHEQTHALQAQGEPRLGRIGGRRALWVEQKTVVLWGEFGVWSLRAICQPKGLGKDRALPLLTGVQDLCGRLWMEPGHGSQHLPDCTWSPTMDQVGSEGL